MQLRTTTKPYLDVIGREALWKWTKKTVDKVIHIRGKGLRVTEGILPNEFSTPYNTTRLLIIEKKKFLRSNETVANIVSDGNIYCYSREYVEFCQLIAEKLSENISIKLHREYVEAVIPKKLPEIKLNIPEPPKTNILNKIEKY